MTRARSVGLDRPLQLDWLDSAATAAAAGVSEQDMREALSAALAADFPTDTYRGSRQKTITLLVRIWGAPRPRGDDPLRQDALLLMDQVAQRERFWLHFGMTLATYPYFRDGVESIGRLLALHGEVAPAEVTRRVASSWGDRSTVRSSIPRLFRTLVDWGVLVRGTRRGTYRSGPRRSTRLAKLERWLITALMRALDRDTLFLRELRATPVLFPFELRLGPSLLPGEHVDVMRHGPEGEIVLRHV